ncbi:MAG: hypothetical protein JJT89_15445 [Nitriliruptoraceae bacterium]|nr:hypothetical protein [Nitriliruptoraceae bacterium]
MPNALPTHAPGPDLSTPRGTGGPHRPKGGSRRWSTAWLACLALLAAVACTDPADPPGGAQGAGVGVLDLADEQVVLEVQRCALRSGRFPDELATDGTETLLVAAGRTAADEPVAVTIRRTRSQTAPQRIETVEVGVGPDQDGTLEALVLYRAEDTEGGGWHELDPNAADPRVPVAAPLLALDGASLRALGTGYRATTGEAVTVQLEASCPVVTDEVPGIA